MLVSFAQETITATGHPANWLYALRGGSRIFGKGGLIQGTKLLGGDVLQHASTRGGLGAWKNFLK